MFVLHFHRFSDQAGDSVGSLGRGSQGDFFYLAVLTFDLESLGGGVEGFQLTFVGDSFPAAGKEGGGTNGDHSDQGEELFHGVLF